MDRLVAILGRESGSRRLEVCMADRLKVSGSHVLCFVHGTCSRQNLVQFESSSDAVIHVGCPVGMGRVASSTALQHNVITVMNCRFVLCLFGLFNVHVNRAGDTGQAWDGLCLGFCKSFARVWSELGFQRMDSSLLHTYVFCRSHAIYLTTGDINSSNNFRPKRDRPWLMIVVS